MNECRNLKIKNSIQNQSINSEKNIFKSFKKIFSLSNSEKSFKTQASKNIQSQIKKTSKLGYSKICILSGQKKIQNIQNHILTTSQVTNVQFNKTFSNVSLRKVG